MLGSADNLSVNYIMSSYLLQSQYRKKLHSISTAFLCTLYTDKCTPGTIHRHLHYLYIYAINFMHKRMPGARSENHTPGFLFVNINQWAQNQKRHACTKDTQYSPAAHLPHRPSHRPCIQSPFCPLFPAWALHDFDNRYKSSFLHY